MERFQHRSLWNDKGLVYLGGCGVRVRVRVYLGGCGLRVRCTLTLTLTLTPNP